MVIYLVLLKCFIAGGLSRSTFWEQDDGWKSDSSASTKIFSDLLASDILNKITLI